MIRYLLRSIEWEALVCLRTEVTNLWRVITLVHSSLLNQVSYKNIFFYSTEWEALGCFKDKGEDRAMPHYFHKANYNPQDPDLKAMFEECRVEAEAEGYTYFGIQNKYECWGSKDAQKTYDKHGCSEKCDKPNDQEYGLGLEWTNFLYRVKKGNFVELGVIIISITIFTEEMLIEIKQYSSNITMLSTMIRNNI